MATCASINRRRDFRTCGKCNGDLAYRRWPDPGHVTKRNDPGVGIVTRQHAVSEASPHAFVRARTDFDSNPFGMKQGAKFSVFGSGHRNDLGQRLLQVTDRLDTNRRRVGELRKQLFAAKATALAGSKQNRNDTH
jgi:hypothetical protein